MKVLVCGSRSFRDIGYVWDCLSDITLKECVENADFIEELIHGACDGPDLFADEWASKSGIPIKSVSADWNKYGKAAGPIRNKEMVDMLTPGEDIVIAFWDGKSKGTKHTINLAKEKGIKTIVLP